MNSVVDHSCIERIVTAANRAPSGENCQPWRFRWEAGELSVCHDAERARHQINHHDHCSLLALGCLLEAIEIAATAEGLESQVSTSLEHEAGRWAGVRLRRGQVSASARAHARDALSAIEQRSTDRRLYRGGSTSHPVFADLERKAATFSDCSLRVLADLPADLVRYLEQADAYVLRHQDVLRDVLRWLRWSVEEVETSRDGVPWRALGFDVPQLRLFTLLRGVDTWQHLQSLGLERATRAWLRLQLSSSAAFGAVTVRAGRRDDLVSAGRLLFIVWITLNRAGFALQPLTHPAMAVYNLASGGLPASTRPEFVELFQRGAGVFERSFKTAEGELPVWCFRTGLARPLPERARSKRLATSAILSFA